MCARKGRGSLTLTLMLFNRPSPLASLLLPRLSFLYSVYSVGGAFSAVPAAALSTPMPAAARWRFGLQRQLLNNTWGTYARFSVSAHIKLPEGFVLRLGLCNVASGVCKFDFDAHDISNQNARQGAHAYVGDCYVCTGFNRAFLLVCPLTPSAATAATPLRTTRIHS